MADDPTPTYEFGLVMAGAISGGAYTAGVVDFLIQALDAWQAAKQEEPDNVPGHRALLRVISGASAGAMTAAMAAVSFGSKITPVTDVDAPPPGAANRLYDGWVRQIDLSELLRTDDLARPDAPVVSLLDASVIRQIGSSALDVEPLDGRRPAVADPLAVYLSVSNLRGVPYSFQLFGGRTYSSYGMLCHKDSMGFAVSRDDTPVPATRPLKPADLPNGDWPLLVNAAIASGAFPVGLAPVVLDRPGSDLDGRYRRGPSWSPIPADYEFLCVDGGLMDNEPFELARQYLSGGEDKHNPQQGDVASKGVILIDPFPNTAALDPDWKPDDRLVSVVQQMYGALVNQARFKPGELELMEAPSVYSRFSVSPSLRLTPDGPPVVPAMAAAVLGGFGGFIDESYRRHDFQLGRRNAQAFLMRHFVLPACNPLFKDLPEAIRERYYVRTFEGDYDTETIDGTEHRLLPIIPVVPALQAPIDPPKRPLPLTAQRLADLEKQVKDRVMAVGNRLISTDIAKLGGTGAIGAVARFGLEQAWYWHYGPKASKEAFGKIKAAAEVLDPPAKTG